MVYYDLFYDLLFLLDFWFNIHFQAHMCKLLIHFNVPLNLKFSKLGFIEKCISILSLLSLTICSTFNYNTFNFYLN